MSTPARHTADLLEQAASQWGDKPFLVDAGTSLSFDAVLKQVRALACGLISRRASHGTRIAIWAPNCSEWVIGALAVHYIGGTLVTLNTRYRGHEAAQILKLSQSKILISVEEFLGIHYPALLKEEDCGQLETTLTIDGTGPDAFDALVEYGTVALKDPLSAMAVVLKSARTDVNGDDLSDILFTSGTTGTPKGVMTTHAQNLRAFSTFAEILGLDSEDRYLIINPFFHSFGYKAGWLACLLVGAEAHPMPAFDSHTVIAHIRDHQITCMPGPPTLFHALIHHPSLNPDDVMSLTKVTTGAAVIPTELVELMWQALGIETVITAYGLTETCGLVTMCRRGDDAHTIATTSGRAVPGVEVAVMSNDGELLSPGETGEIVVRGFNVMCGYLDEHDATASAIDSDGWLHTGDVGSLDTAGNLTITDRLKDMYISGGFNCYPAEIEQLLTRHPAIEQAAVVGFKDQRLGEVGAAFLVGPNEQRPDDQTLMQWCKDEIANYKVPRIIHWVEELPLNASGKVLKTTLRAQL
jgi:acyl-CoA synthetase (AMP-forming)/AMP-acid ligase II